jgi:hypothetical protein
VSLPQAGASSRPSRVQRQQIERGRTQEVFEMAKLSEKSRDSMKGSTFGLPEQRKYPMPDESHARNAKARASQQVKKGNLSKADERKIDRKADSILKD